MKRGNEYTRCIDLYMETHLQRCSKFCKVSPNFLNRKRIGVLHYYISGCNEFLVGLRPNKGGFLEVLCRL